ncbi:hypothetical protein E1B28_004990 [Marasmius oreades]|uniref:DUF6533 domain-containing protein n=1 Tax=Marasmius oreades TaxID=181124 RepID=A0A9P8ADJ6_9AGAR|nr:uncharacterized protein E1B28_004990 [Marasmius oreades]KAG7097662.1 hypothetical protein E1B28_004990 [Marasmius oreades]
MNSQSPEQIAEHIRLIKMFSLSSFVVLIYDVLLTFADEVEYIWNMERRKHSWMVQILWCVNRYLWPLAFIVIIVTQSDPYWSENACQRYVWYPQIIRLLVTIAVGVYFILYLKAVHFGNKIATTVSSLLLIAEVAVKIWASLDIEGVRFPHFGGCFMTSKSPPNRRFVYGYVAELVFDSIMLAATAYRCYHMGIKTSTHIRVIWEESISYLPIIFVVHLANVLIYTYAPFHLKNIMTSYSTLGCSVVVSHMVLNTRKKLNQCAFSSSEAPRGSFETTVTIQFAQNTSKKESMFSSTNDVSFINKEYVSSTACGGETAFSEKESMFSSTFDASFINKGYVSSAACGSEVSFSEKGSMFSSTIDASFINKEYISSAACGSETVFSCESKDSGTLV